MFFCFMPSHIICQKWQCEPRLNTYQIFENIIYFKPSFLLQRTIHDITFEIQYNYSRNAISTNLFFYWNNNWKLDIKKEYNYLRSARPYFYFSIMLNNDMIDSQYECNYPRIAVSTCSQPFSAFHKNDSSKG